MISKVDGIHSFRLFTYSFVWVESLPVFWTKTLEVYVLIRKRMKETVDGIVVEKSTITIFFAAESMQIVIMLCIEW